eukprot:TRINITY_DN6088_c0_g1_i1.p1 TRINITY_DN6088_c0_g1~~TRINITY_DN6088_c0_g1_i1.p1  ORF type:complete len:178 (-),score=12.20 TRINITY_DN6088_c0_g1_i1:178-711(-)
MSSSHLAEQSAFAIVLEWQFEVLHNQPVQHQTTSKSNIVFGQTSFFKRTTKKIYYDQRFFIDEPKLYYLGRNRKIASSKIQKTELRVMWKAKGFGTDVLRDKRGCYCELSHSGLKALRECNEGIIPKSNGHHHSGVYQLRFTCRKVEPENESDLSGFHVWTTEFTIGSTNQHAIEPK